MVQDLKSFKKMDLSKNKKPVLYAITQPWCVAVRTPLLNGARHTLTIPMVISSHVHTGVRALLGEIELREHFYMLMRRM